MANLRALLLFFFLVPLCLAQNYCSSDTQCPYGYKCWQVGQPGGGVGNRCVRRGSTSSNCYSDADCPQGQSCGNVNGILTCQITAGGGIGNGASNGAGGKTCYSNNDCGYNEQCMYVNGANRCQIIAGGGIGGNGGNSGNGQGCQTMNDCPIGQQCVYNSAYGQSYCQNANGGPTAGGIGSGANGGERCTQDYQCRQGESCSATSADGSRYCIYNTYAQRQCLFNSDCLPGEICVWNAGLGKSICQASPDAGNQQISCNYDFQCPGNERCTSVYDNGQQVWRCRNSNQPDSKRSGPCDSNNDCPSGQTCQYQSQSQGNRCVDVQNNVIFNALPNDSANDQSTASLGSLNLKPQPRSRRSVVPMAPLAPPQNSPPFNSLNVGSRRSVVPMAPVAPPQNSPPFSSPNVRSRRSVVPMAVVSPPQNSSPFNSRNVGSQLGGNFNGRNVPFVHRSGPYMNPQFARQAPLADLLNVNE